MVMVVVVLMVLTVAGCVYHPYDDGSDAVVLG